MQASLNMTPLTEFYSGKTVFVTGATGFMGKVLLEKLVRCLPDIKKIYILLRPKKGCTPKERMMKLAENTIFKFNNMTQRAYVKIEVISGDISKDDFDMTKEDKEKLINEVSVVFHFAASVRMDLPLKEAVITNSKSTYQLYKFSMKIKNLKSIVHLSTTYCNVEVKNMGEKVYPLKLDPYKIIDLVDWMDEKSLNAITKNLLGRQPNTYTFSKRLAEMIAGDMGEKLPIIIVRPSIVFPTLIEPIQGWVDNFNGPVGSWIGMEKGIVIPTFINPAYTPEVIPVDIAINAVICSAYERSKSNPSSTPVVNATHCGRYPVNWLNLAKESSYHFNKSPYKHVLWYPNYFFVTRFDVFLLATFFFQIIPSLLVDFLLIMFLQKPFLLRMQKRIYHTWVTLREFNTKKWTFSNDNLLKLEENLDEADKKVFYGIKSADMDVHAYIGEIYHVIKKYLVNDSSENIELYKFRNKILYLLDRSLKIAFIYFVSKWSSNCVFNLIMKD